MRPEDAARLFHTVRHLRPVQIVGRAAFRLRRPRVRRAPAPPVRPAGRAWRSASWRAPSLLGPDTARFLNRTRRVADAAAWNHPEWEKLWLYHLHYFDDLRARDAAHRAPWHRALVERWIAENPAPRGNGWEPYPISLRAVNWIAWALAGNALEDPWRQSLALQLRVLAQRLEWHLLGNHLLANAKALVFGGLWFAGPEAERWLATGLGILARQLPEQLLADGGHFERSPMYHALVLEDVLDLLELTALYGADAHPALGAAAEGWRARVPAMLAWLAAMTHPDGGIGFFNDAALAAAPDHRHLAARAADLGVAAQPPDGAGEGLVHLAPSGYVRAACGAAVCLLDAAPVGPDYLPGHAHADTLSFELSLHGRRVVVNGGTSRYGEGPERLRERGTAAHSTVQVDGADSSEVWGGFRVARRARPFGLEVGEGDGTLRVACAHDGYRRLGGRPVHRRQWRLGAAALEVRDRIEGGFREAVARFHLHPEVAVEQEGACGRLRLPGGVAVRWDVAGGEVALRSSLWHPELGRSLETRCLEVRFAGPEIRTRFQWG